MLRVCSRRVLPRAAASLSRTGGGARAASAFIPGVPRALDDVTKLDQLEDLHRVAIAKYNDYVEADQAWRAMRAEFAAFYSPRGPKQH